MKSSFVAARQSVVRELADILAMSGTGIRVVDAARHGERVPGERTLQPALDAAAADLARAARLEIAIEESIAAIGPTGATDEKP